MPLIYRNRRDQDYTLYEGRTRTGKPTYYFSIKQKADKPSSLIPEGFEIYEEPDGEVFLRRKSDVVIRSEEAKIVEDAMSRFCEVELYWIDIRKDTITVCTSEPHPTFEHHPIIALSEAKAEEYRFRSANFTPVLRFVLHDKKQRIFKIERYCFRGMGGWIEIATPGGLEEPGTQVRQASWQAIVLRTFLWADPPD